MRGKEYSSIGIVPCRDVKSYLYRFVASYHPGHQACDDDEDSLHLLVVPPGLDSIDGFLAWKASSRDLDIKRASTEASERDSVRVDASLECV